MNGANVVELMWQSFAAMAQDAEYALSKSLESGIRTHYAELLRWNRTHNLTRITQPEEAAQHHYFDSVFPFQWIGSKTQNWTTLLDVGTGAGFPGLVVAPLFPEREIHLLDASRKRCSFLTHVSRQMQLDNVTVHHSRVEESTQSADLVLTRATFSWDLGTGSQRSARDKKSIEQNPFEQLKGCVNPGGHLCFWVGQAPLSDQWEALVQASQWEGAKRWEYALPQNGSAGACEDGQTNENIHLSRGLLMARAPCE